MAMLDSVRKMFGQRKADAATSYRKLVEHIASGKPAPAEAVDIAIAAGKSVQDLERDSTLLTQRLEAAAQMQAADGMQSRLLELQQAADAASRALAELRERHQQELRDAESAQRAAREAVRSAGNRQSVTRSRAVETLLRTADPAIDRQIQSLEHQRQQVLMQKNELGNKLPLRSVTDGMVPAAADAKPETVGDLRQAELKRLDTLAVELGERIRELEARKLDPAACAIG